ncbi:MAG TPA: hypothetical protein VNT99_03285, partial [Methylomirabilota bacterium]|nr:hypothetical protein [Methylomirabilota bacterium]
QEAKVPIVPVFIENMQFVSTKTGRFHPVAGWRKVEVHYGPPIEPADYLPISRREFSGFVREQISAIRPTG